MAKSFKFKDKLRFLWRAWRYRWNLDPREISILRRTLKPGDVAIDIGTHKGAYTYWMSKCVGSQGHVYGFEPQIRLAERLWSVLDALNLSNVSVRNMGLSSSPGVLNLFIPGSNASSPEATFEQPERYVEGRFQEVEVAILDQLLAEEKRPIRFIKCDVEGHELEVFKGCEAILRQFKPALLFECEARHHQDGDIGKVFKYLQSLGYEGSFFLGRKQLPLDQFHSDYQKPGIKPYANNFLFVVNSKV